MCKLPSWWFVEIIFYKPASCFSLWRPRPQRGLSSLEALIRFCFQSTYGKRRNIKDGELGVSDNCLLPICKGGTKKEKALLVRACACDCPLEAKNLIETTFCECWLLGKGKSPMFLHWACQSEAQRRACQRRSSLDRQAATLWPGVSYFTNC